MTTLSNVLVFHRYGECLVAGGGYVFVSFLSTDYHYHVARLDDATLTLDADVDLGAAPFNDTHFYPCLAIDPTDNKLLVSVGGRTDTVTDYPSRIAKTAHAYGGSTAEWAANDFGGWVDLPYPSSGLVSYNHTRITPDGTLVVVGGSRTGATHGLGDVGVYVYRYIGDGTPKTAAQMATGTWTKVIGRATDLTSGAIYAGRIDYRGGRLGICYHYFEAFTTATESNFDGTSRRRGLAYVYTDDVESESWVWRDAAGNAIALPIANNAAQRVTPLYAHNEYGDYFGSLSLSSTGVPHLVSTRTVLAGALYDYQTSGVSAYTWNGSAWAEQVLYPHDADALFGMGTTRSVTDSSDRAYMITSRPDDGVVAANGVYVDVFDGSFWQMDSLFTALGSIESAQVATVDSGIIVAGQRADSVYVGHTSFESLFTYDFDVLLGAPWTAPALITAPLVMTAAAARESASLASGPRYATTASGTRWSAAIN